MKKITFPITILITILCTVFSCSDNPITPPEELEPGRRDYVWTVDTLDMPMNYISSVWGASPDDVWAVGGAGTQYDRLLHYNGTEWETYTKEIIWCTGNTLYGFSSNDVWMGGGGGWLDGGAGIWHYNGSKWSKNFIYNVDEAYITDVYDIWGSQSNDLYACGIIDYRIDGKDNLRGFVLHYDGSIWKEVVRADFNSQFLDVRKEQNKVYVFALKTTLSACDTVVFYELNGSELKEIYSSPEDEIVFGNFHYINGKVYFLIAQDVYRYINGNFVEQFSLGHQNFGYQFYGRHEKDIFVRMRDGLAHYNGTDIEYLYNFPLNMVSIRDEPVLFENDVFFALRSEAKNMVLHGRLE
ncbi:MAG: hypothetical protein PVH88_27440 [Ignavibacteria bacterium]|jgi:hypothetical protein